MEGRRKRRRVRENTITKLSSKKPSSSKRQCTGPHHDRNHPNPLLYFIPTNCGRASCEAVPYWLAKCRDHLWASSMMRYRQPILLREVFSMLATSYVVRSTSHLRSSSRPPGLTSSLMMVARSSYRRPGKKRPGRHVGKTNTKAEKKTYRHS